MPLKFAPATIKALATLVQVLDNHRFGAVMLVLVMVAAGALMSIPYIPVALVEASYAPSTMLNMYT
jgi:hypothetical protein